MTINIQYTHIFHTYIYTYLHTYAYTHMHTSICRSVVRSNSIALTHRLFLIWNQPANRYIFFLYLGIDSVLFLYVRINRRN
jgi:hypothetical protein